MSIIIIIICEQPIDRVRLQAAHKQDTSASSP